MPRPLFKIRPGSRLNDLAHLRAEIGEGGDASAMVSPIRASPGRRGKPPAAASTRGEALDPRGVGVDEGAQEGAGVLVRDRAALVEELRGAADVRLRLLQRGHVEEDEALTQVVVRAEAADRARRDADHRRRLALPRALSVRARADVDRVL